MLFHVLSLSGSPALLQSLCPHRCQAATSSLMCGQRVISRPPRDYWAVLPVCPIWSRLFLIQIQNYNILNHNLSDAFPRQKVQGSRGCTRSLHDWVDATYLTGGDFKGTVIAGDSAKPIERTRGRKRCSYTASLQARDLF